MSGAFCKPVGYRRATAASMGRESPSTPSARRERASSSTEAAGRYSASTTTGARNGSVMRTSGRKAGWPVMTWVFSARARTPCIIPRSRSARAALALDSACLDEVVMGFAAAARV